MPCTSPMASLKRPQFPLRAFSFPFPCSHPCLASFSPRLPVAKASFNNFRFLCSGDGPNPRRVVALRSSTCDCGNDSVEEERPPFDLNLAVVLAGFAFEAYSTPPEDAGWREADAADCQTVFLSGQFIREVYDGQLQIKLKKGEDLPAMDPWGTSDPYVVLQVEGQVAKSMVKWASKEPTWNEDLTLNIRKTEAKILQVAAWDANLVTPHKGMGNAIVNIESLCDGNLHEVVVELEGTGGIGGGGGKIYLEVIYKSYDEIEEGKQWWRMPFLSDFLIKTNYASALKLVLGSEGINVSQFVESTFGQLKTLTYYLEKPKPSSSNNDNADSQSPDISVSRLAGATSFLQQESSSESSDRSGDNSNLEKEFSSLSAQTNAEESSSLEIKYDKSETPEYFWRTFADKISQVVHQRLGISLPEIKVWEGFDMLSKVSLQSQRNAEKDYVESGLATPKDMNSDERTDQPSSVNPEYPFLDIMKLSRDVLSQTETIFGALLILTAIFSQRRNNFMPSVDQSSNEDMSKVQDESAEYSADDGENLAIEGFPLDTQRAEMRELFSRAESAMEAWSMLATSLGRESFIKSDFEKICFLDNIATDTQVAIWRDSLRRRLVVAFRGTEQSKWKDLATDLMLLPTGLTPERLSGECKQEVQVHSGFLNAYDSVKNRIMALIEYSMVFKLEDDPESASKWKVYVTGHSLGGALATLLALELSVSQMAKHGKISVTMYNFGSPRVGNRRFAELYNEKVKDSWRIVNQRDIIPTVPRLMGYCHVAKPVYLAAGDLKGLINREVLGDGYQDDLLGESTPDMLLNEIMKGEGQLIEQILQTEINLLRSIRDGTALMQHMEDFYYITLLESVRSNRRHRHRRTDNSNSSSSDA